MLSTLKISMPLLILGKMSSYFSVKECKEQIDTPSHFTNIYIYICVFWGFFWRGMSSSTLFFWIHHLYRLNCLIFILFSCSRHPSPAVNCHISPSSLFTSPSSGGVNHPFLPSSFHLLQLLISHKENDIPGS